MKYVFRKLIQNQEASVPQETSKKPSKSRDKGKGKFKDKVKKNAIVKKEGDKLTCKHCSKIAMMKTIVGNYIQN